MAAMKRPVWMEIELEAIERNLAEIRRRVGSGRHVIASVKGNAYGFGVVEISRAVLAQGAYALWTGNVDEALRLRAAGINDKILMFGGYLPEHISELVRHQLVPTIYDESGLEAASAAGAAKGGPVAVLVKVDAGLGRLGVPVIDALDYLKRASRQPHVTIEGVYTHLPFSSAAERDWALTRYALFAELIGNLHKAGIAPPITQAWGSSGVLAGLPDCCNAVCVGHLLYGLNPLNPEVADSEGLQPALTALKASLIHVGHHLGGSDLAIGGAYAIRNARSTGVIAFGIGDGMRRIRPGKQMEALVRGKRVPVIGTSLEHTVLALDTVEMPRVGEEVVLVGKQGNDEIRLDDWAEAVGCNPLEAMMSFSGRIEARYMNSADSIWGAFRS
jgi:alanine racemase